MNLTQGLDFLKVLTKDIEEKNDLSSQHPERVKQMQMLAQQRLASIRAKSIPLGQAKAE